MKVAIAHDFLSTWGGAERVCLELSRLYPDAPIYTIFYNKKNMDKYFDSKRIITSSLQTKASILNYNHRFLIPFMARAVEEFDFKDFDVVISSQSAWMKGIITKPETVHVSYCHTPTRFLWTEFSSYTSGVKGFLFSKILSKLRIWDKLASDRVDYFIANSINTKKRIKKFYQKDATVIYPPVDTEKFNINNEGDKGYFLIVSRLSGYKSIDIAIKAFGNLNLPLVIVGEGPELKKLKRLAGKNIKFLDFIEDHQLVKLTQRARGFVFPTFDEDFGLAPVEAMSCGVPVIAAKSGGSLETVVDGKTGVFFGSKSSESVERAVRKFIEIEGSLDKRQVRENAKRFSKETFDKEIRDFVENCYKKGI